MTGLRVHHLNCGTMHPRGRRLINGDGGLLAPGLMVCHCLLVETEQGLVLIDSGYGLADIEDPARTLSRSFRMLTRPRLDPEETALRQVERLGYRPEDVRHIVLTHLDVDHAGGLRDFPWATVHVHAREYDRAMRGPTLNERLRYRSGQWTHGPDWATYAATGEPWFGFDAVRELSGLPPEILLVPLPGHTHGHTGVAVDTGARWLLHAGDAYMFRDETDPAHPHATPGLALFQSALQVDRQARHRNQARLRDLRAAHGAEVEVFSAHDHVELARYIEAPAG
ncbi:MBL fold metallo-hydrolase [Haloechinothrix halophila]|uniref:MBL fold metallo-hydrolase n=1 Tax=Haloechinothrix halophila TaxID=1069073 RepID=UPI00041EFBFF|nr:MBL fold metallo-hydrolase [Haloechinothrix halophila]